MVTISPLHSLAPYQVSGDRLPPRIQDNTVVALNGLQKPQKLNSGGWENCVLPAARRAFVTTEDCRAKIFVALPGTSPSAIFTVMTKTMQTMYFPGCEKATPNRD